MTTFKKIAAEIANETNLPISTVSKVLSSYAAKLLDGWDESAALYKSAQKKAKRKVRK